MMNTDDLSEIESLGEEYEEEEQEQDYRDGGPGGQQKQYSLIPVLQMAACALLLLTLLYFRFADEPKYEQAVQWYQSEAAKAVELPQLEKKTEAANPESGAESKSEPAEQTPSPAPQNQSVKSI